MLNLFKNSYAYYRRLKDEDISFLISIIVPMCYFFADAHVNFQIFSAIFYNLMSFVVIIYRLDDKIILQIVQGFLTSVFPIPFTLSNHT